MERNNKTYGASLSLLDLPNPPFVSVRTACPSSRQSDTSSHPAGFANVDQEAEFVIPTLWQTTQQFMQQAPKHYFPEGRDESFVSGDGGKSYNHRVRRGGSFVEGG